MITIYPEGGDEYVYQILMAVHSVVVETFHMKQFANLMVVTKVNRIHWSSYWNNEYVYQI